MSIPTRCPKCRQDYLLADTQAGKTVRCRKCETPFLVTAAKPEPEPKPEPAREPARPAAEPRRSPDSPARRPKATRSPRPAPPRKSYLALGLVLAGSCVAVLVCLAVAGGGLYWWYRFINQEKDNAKPLVASNGTFVPGGGQPNGPNFEDVPEVEEPAEAPEVVQADLPPANADPTNPLGVRVVEPPAGDDPQPAVGSDLAPDVLRRVKRNTLYLRVTLPNGQIAQGSGFFAGFPGVIMTNAHVVGMLLPGSAKPKKIEVTQNGGRADENKFQAVVLGIDRASDLAVLRAQAPTVPPPLEIHSARELQETQKVYIFGFPFGDSLGKSVTISVSSVSSLREDKGVLHRVQVNGGMHPGNSGGPLVDAKGNVVGVSVAVIRNSQINFAVPGDNVRSLLSGRLSGAVEIDQPYYAGDRVLAPVALRLLDPLNRVRAAAVDVWTGDAGGSRPASDKQPEERPGDSPHQRVPLTLAAGAGQGEVTLPPLQAGKVYWVQPVWDYGGGQSHWERAQANPLKSPPVRREPANLVLHQEAGNHSLSLTTKNALMLRGMDSDHALELNMVAKLQEGVSNVNAQGSEVELKFSNLDVDHNQTGQQQHEAVNHIDRISMRRHLDGQGNLSGPAHLDLGQVPVESRNKLQPWTLEMQQSMDLLTVPLPNKEVPYGEHWKARRELFFSGPGMSEHGSVWMTYTYLGRRKRDGHDEAVVGITGIIRGGRGQDLHLGGHVRGTAVIDLASGRLSQGEVSVGTDLNASVLGNPVEASGTIQATVQRTLP
jgi:S1-C subfamily serine protease